MFRMTPVTPERGAGISGTQLRQAAVGAGDGEITGERGSEGLRAVRYALLEDAADPDQFGIILDANDGQNGTEPWILDWEGERQAFAGRRTEPIDVELFRHIETAG